MCSLLFASPQATEKLTDGVVYNLLKDFSLPLLAIIWAVYSYLKQNRKKLSIRQLGDQYSNSITSQEGSRTSYSVEVAITNDSPQAPIVIAWYDIELPWNEASLDPLPDPKDSDKPLDFYSYTTPAFSIQLDRENVLNHRRYQSGKLAPGEGFRGYFLAKGDMPIPNDLAIYEKDRCDRFIEAKFVVKDTTGREYKSPIHLHY
jgi:hypothetical protein